LPAISVTPENAHMDDRATVPPVESNMSRELEQQQELCSQNCALVSAHFLEILTESNEIPDYPVYDNT